MGNSAPAWRPFCGAVAVPVTRVFSPYVVQAGSARPRVRAGLLLQRSTGLVREVRATRGELPRVICEVILGAGAGSLSPHRGEGLGHRCGRGREALLRR